MPTNTIAVALRRASMRADGTCVWSMVEESDWNSVLEHAGEEIGVFLSDNSASILPYSQMRFVILLGCLPWLIFRNLQPVKPAPKKKLVHMYANKAASFTSLRDSFEIVVVDSFEVVIPRLGTIAQILWYTMLIGTLISRIVRG
jgi:hypothetical protein